MGGKIRVSLDFDLDEVKKMLGPGSATKVLSEAELERLAKSGFVIDDKGSKPSQRMVLFQISSMIKQTNDWWPEESPRFEPMYSKHQSLNQVTQHITQHNGLYCAASILGIDKEQLKKE